MVIDIAGIGYLSRIVYSSKPHPLLSLHSSFTPNFKNFSSTNPILICLLLPRPLPFSTPNTIHISRLTVCLPDSRDYDPLPIDFTFGQAPVIKLVPPISLLWAL